METQWEGFIAGLFEGYEGGRVYELTNGTRWRQDDRTKEYVYRERAKAKLLWNQSTGTHFLEVEGTSGGGGSRDGTGGERFSLALVLPVLRESRWAAVCESRRVSQSQPSKH
ncbi:hypothetical protein [Singulisphaera acidiphila]|uniref:Uncharacterized protein n=1 Tax=Singulisphaera acidiphila (strain ATCC BAA-1392 / DSM 18658 / VKM B-2454 / MOB10) TaxID=886293 RepID=L0DCN7_SINAD|nr:hypothetical protein [Singulisphaera acidiphila]AGA26396.1 hypothetical protein Sinac_2059 [Singulisphaera acidiphila DSM 18658]